ncbi:unnamed protein product [Pylaiella littoralis]
MIMNDCRRFSASFITVVALSCGGQSFVAHQNSLLRVGGVQQEQQRQHQRQQRTSSSRNRRSLQQRECTVMMTAESGDSEVVVPQSGGPMDRRQALSKVWNAALSLSVLGAATVVVAGGAAPAEAGIGEDIGGFLLPPQDQSPEILVGETDSEISFEDFERKLLKGEVTKCEFFGSNFDKAVIVLNDGTRALIGKGYPQERAFSDDSPMKVVGLLRNAGVPFSTQFNTGKYAKPKSYKSSETLQAENRQKSEDQALELLMSQ